MGEYEIRDDFCGHIKNIAEKMCTESQLQESLEFVDISTLEERLLGENSITHEFTDKIAVMQGADEIDVVMNLGYFLEENYDELSEEIQEIKESCRDAKLKVILETGALQTP